MGARDLYKIGEVAAMLGVTAHTIRAWERRHGILQPERTTSGQRRYRPEDVELLREVKRAVELNGLSIRLAFKTVTVGPQVLEPPVKVVAQPKAPELVLPPANQSAWQALGDIMPQLVLLIDRTGRIVEANVAAAKAFGVVREKLTQRAFASMVVPWDRAKAVLLYRPGLRRVERWELNLATPAGPRLFSFQSWPVRLGEDELLALIGSDTYLSAPPRSPQPPPEVMLRTAAPLPASEHQPATDNALQALVDHLPFGVAVATIGIEPRLVYANAKLSGMLQITRSSVTGRPLSQLLPRPTLLRLRQAVHARAVRTVKGVADIRRVRRAPHRRSFDVAFQPLFSSVRKVAGVLIVVQDTRTQAAQSAALDRFDLDPRIRRVRTPDRLGEIALSHLGSLLPGIPHGLALPASPGSARPLAITRRSAGRAVADDSRSIAALHDALSSATATRRSTERRIVLHNVPYTWTAIPLATSGRAGALAWLTPAHMPLDVTQRATIEAFAARVGVVVELLHWRAESVRARSVFEAMRSVLSVMKERGGQGDLAWRFLERLSRVVRADSAAIGRLAGSDVVIVAAYVRPRAGLAPVKPGDRFPIARRTLSGFLSNGRAVKCDDHPSLAAAPSVRHALLVPAVFMGTVSHVITLARVGARPFGPHDVQLVESLANAALHAVAVTSAGHV